jgi:chromosome segregation ATPase
MNSADSSESGGSVDISEIVTESMITGIVQRGDLSPLDSEPTSDDERTNCHDRTLIESLRSRNEELSLHLELTIRELNRFRVLESEAAFTSDQNKERIELLTEENGGDNSECDTRVSTECARHLAVQAMTFESQITSLVAANTALMEQLDSYNIELKSKEIVIRGLKCQLQEVEERLIAATARCSNQDSIILSLQQRLKDFKIPLPGQGNAATNTPYQLLSACRPVC